MTVEGSTVPEKNSNKSRFEFLSVLFCKVVVLKRCARQKEMDLGGQLVFMAVSPKAEVRV